MKKETKMYCPGKILKIQNSIKKIQPSKPQNKDIKDTDMLYVNDNVLDIMLSIHKVIVSVKLDLYLILAVTVHPKSPKFVLILVASFSN